MACTVQKLKFDFVKAWYPYRARASCMQQWKQQLNFRLWQYVYFCQLTKVLLLLRLLPVLAPWIPRYPVKHIYQIFTWFSKDSQTFFYLGIIWVGTSLTRFCWYAPVVLGCFLWGELFASCKRVRIPQTGKFLLVESEILGLGIRNTTQRIRNPTKDWNPESKFHWQNEINNLESGIRGVKFKIQDCLADSLSRGETFAEHLDSNLCFETNWDHRKFRIHSAGMPVLILMDTGTGPERMWSKESATAHKGVDVQVRIIYVSPIHINVIKLFYQWQIRNELTISHRQTASKRVCDRPKLSRSPELALVLYGFDLSALS